MHLLVAPPSVRKLKWAPPAQTSPTVASTGTGFFGPTYAADEDVILTVPGLRLAQLTVTGGRHIRIIGGKTRLNAAASGTAAMRFTGVTGSVFIEGYHVDTNGAAGNKHDGIVVTGSTSAPYTITPDVYLQNCRVEGVMSTFAQNHADIFQPQGSIGTLYIDKLTGKSNYQGIFVRQEFPITAAHLSQVNLSYEAGGDGNTYLLWFPSSTPPTAPYPVTLRKVWVDPRAGQEIIDVGVWPKAGEVDGSTPIGAYWVDDDETKAAWPINRLITGYVYSGSPPRGDYVPSTVAGLSYVSPGYA